MTDEQKYLNACYYQPNSPMEWICAAIPFLLIPTPAILVGIVLFTRHML